MDSLFGHGYPYPYYCCPTDSTKTQTNCNPWLWMANYNWPADNSSWTYGSGDVDMEQYLAYGMCCNSQKAEKIKVLTKLIGPSNTQWIGTQFAEKHFIDGNFLKHLSTATVDHLYEKLYVSRTKDDAPLEVNTIKAAIGECAKAKTDAHYSVLLDIIINKKGQSLGQLSQEELETIPDLKERGAFRSDDRAAYYPSSRSYYAMDEDDDLLAPRSTHTYRAYRPTNYYGSSAHNYYD